MSLTIYTYSNPYELKNEPYWDSIRMCAHFCVSQTMVNGLREVYKELNQGQLTTVEELIEGLYPAWFDTKTYVEQYALLTNALDSVKPNISLEKWSKVKQALRFNKSELLDSIRLLCEMGINYTDLKIKNLSEEQLYLVATYRKIREVDQKKKFEIKRSFSGSEIDNAVKKALVAKDERLGKKPKPIQHVDCDTVIFHGIHQFTPTILYAIEEISKYKRVVLLFNYQEQYKEIYQTWVDVYSCFDVNIKSQFNNEFRPTSLLQTSYQGNLLGDTLARLACGEYVKKVPEFDSISVIKFDNITEFSAYVAKIYEEAKQKFDEMEGDEAKSALSYMKEQFYAANNEVNDILKVYFPEQFGERHFLAYPIGHFFVAVTNMWDAENGGIHIDNLDNIAECLYSEALPEKQTGSLITTFNATKNYFSRATDFEEIICLLKKLKQQKQKIAEEAEFSEQLSRLSYYNVSIGDLEELIAALNTLSNITKMFYEDFEKEENNFKHFYEKVREFLERQVLPNVEAESEFQDILLRLLVRLEEAQEMNETSSFDCLKDTMAYYLKQKKQKGDSADWIVRDFQQIDGDILMSSNQDSSIVYHFACVSDEDMNVKKEDQFPWPLNLEFFERAYEPLDWKYQVYIKSRREFKHFKRYALIYGLVFNRCNFKLSYVKNNDDKENELYYLLKLLQVGENIEENQHDSEKRQKYILGDFDIGSNRCKFVREDGFRRRICTYRFALETMIEGGTKYKDRFLQSKYFEILLTNQTRRKLVRQIATEDVINQVLEREIEDLIEYFIFLNESELTDIRSKVKATLRHQVLQNGRYKRFPEISNEDADCMRKKEEFIYLHLENENKKNVLSGKFNELTLKEKITFVPDSLKQVRYFASVNIWCQWCANREICLECYKSETER